jgi:hypothetical protein
LNSLDNIAHALHDFKLIPSKKVDVHVDPLFKRGNFRVKAAHIQKRFNVTTPKDSCKPLA